MGTALPVIDWKGDVPQGDSLLENVNFYLQQAFSKLDIDSRFPGDDIVGRLLEPDSVVERKISLLLDDGRITHVTAYRAQHNNDAGIYKGGIRWDAGVTRDEITALSSGMTWKCALAGLPFGGAKGGITVDPNALSVWEKERLAKGYMRTFNDILGPDRDVPAPDMGTDGRIMAWMFKRYTELCNGRIVPGIVTGKPVGLFGSHGRTEATGFGLVLTTDNFIPVKGKRVVIQGCGNVGMHAALKVQRMGGTVTGIADPFLFGGGLMSTDGIDVEQLSRDRNSLDIDAFRSKYPATDTAGDVFESECDILMPCARENVITEANAVRLKAAVIAEGANGPTTPGAYRLLHARGTVCIPDILANAGGVVVSYFEWLQNLHEEYWDGPAVQEKLKIKMDQNAQALKAYAEGHGTDYRTAAYMKAVEKVACAKQLLGPQ